MISDLQLLQLTLDIKTVGIEAADPSQFYMLHGGCAKGCDHDVFQNP